MLCVYIYFVVVYRCHNIIYANLHALFIISDAVAAQSLSLYDGVDDDQLIAAAELAETTNNQQADAVNVQEWPLTDDEIIYAACQYLPYSNLL